MSRPLALLSRIALLLAAFAAVLQWAVPHGWMIGNARSGAALLVPCPGVSPALAALAGPMPEAQPEAEPAPMSHPMPMGMMMAHGGDHAAHMAMAEPAPADHADHAEHDGHDGHESLASALCDFAALGAPVLPPAPLDLDLLPLQPVAPPDPPRLALLPGRGLAAPPPPATGPPALLA